MRWGDEKCIKRNNLLEPADHACHLAGHFRGHFNAVFLDKRAPFSAEGGLCREASHP